MSSLLELEECVNLLRLLVLGRSEQDAAAPMTTLLALMSRWFVLSSLRERLLVAEGVESDSSLLLFLVERVCSLRGNGANGGTV